MIATSTKNCFESFIVQRTAHKRLPMPVLNGHVRREGHEKKFKESLIIIINWSQHKFKWNIREIQTPSPQIKTKFIL